jgi:hypothetical protein
MSDNTKSDNRKENEEVRIITSDDTERIYGDLGFVKQTLDIAFDRTDGIESIIDEALRKTDTLMDFIVDLPKRKEGELKAS